jgi:hypothetical protein
MRGLLPRCTADHNYPGYSGQPQGVFGLPLGRPAWWGWFGEGERDVYVVDIAGLKTTTDGIISHAIVVTERVTPDRIVALISTEEEEESLEYKELSTQSYI